MFSFFNEGHEGDADANDNKITVRELHAYVEQNGTAIIWLTNS